MLLNFATGFQSRSNDGQKLKARRTNHAETTSLPARSRNLRGDWLAGLGAFAKAQGRRPVKFSRRWSVKVPRAAADDEGDRGQSQ